MNDLNVTHPSMSKVNNREVWAEFESAKSRQVYSEDIIKRKVFCTAEDVQEHTVDKATLRPIIKELFEGWTNNVYEFECDSTAQEEIGPMSDKLKELGLL